MIPFSKARPFVGLVVALCCFLVLAIALLSQQQQKRLHNTTARDLQGDIDLISIVTLESLLNADYASVRNIVNEWGEKRPEHHEFRVVAPNGFVIAEHRSSVPPAGETLSLTKDVVIGQTKLATIQFLGDYQETDKMIAGIRLRLIGAAVLLTVVLGAALWLIFRNMAIGPLEDAVRERTRDLVAANQELEQLTNNSPT